MSKRSKDCAEGVPAAAPPPRESAPIRWGPPPLEPITAVDGRDAGTFGEEAEETHATAEAATPQRSSLSLVPRSLKVTRPERMDTT